MRSVPGRRERRPGTNLIWSPGGPIRPTEPDPTGPRHLGRGHHCVFARIHERRPGHAHGSHDRYPGGGRGPARRLWPQPAPLGAVRAVHGPGGSGGFRGLHQGGTTRAKPGPGAHPRDPGTGALGNDPGHRGGRGRGGPVRAQEGFVDRRRGPGARPGQPGHAHLLAGPNPHHHFLGEASSSSPLRPRRARRNSFSRPSPWPRTTSP